MTGIHGRTFTTGKVGLRGKGFVAVLLGPHAVGAIPKHVGRASESESNISCSLLGPR